jgi:hypothetical protein
MLKGWGHICLIERANVSAGRDDLVDPVENLVGERDVSATLGQSGATGTSYFLRHRRGGSQDGGNPPHDGSEITVTVVSAAYLVRIVRAMFVGNGGQWLPHPVDTTAPGC